MELSKIVQQNLEMYLLSLETLNWVTSWHRVRLLGKCYQNLLLFGCFFCCRLLCGHRSWNADHRRTVWHSKHPHCPPVELCTASQKLDFSLFHLPIMETTTSLQDRLSMNYRSNTLCCDKHCKLFLRLFVSASRITPTTSSVRTDVLLLRPIVRSSHIFPVSSDCLTLQ
jgi:hypothetical protein